MCVCVRNRQRAHRRCEPAGRKSRRQTVFAAVVDAWDIHYIIYRYNYYLYVRRYSIILNRFSHRPRVIRNAYIVARESE